jgi:hypothetical protein
MCFQKRKSLLLPVKFHFYDGTDSYEAIKNLLMTFILFTFHTLDLELTPDVRLTANDPQCNTWDLWDNRFDLSVEDMNAMIAVLAL